MSKNVSDFVRNTSDSMASVPPKTTHTARTDRTFALSHKIGKKAHVPEAQFQHQQAPITTQTTNHFPNNRHGSRFNNGNPPRYQEEDGRKTILDSEADDDFDVTKSSDLTVEQTESVGGQYYSHRNERDNAGDPEYLHFEGDRRDRWVSRDEVEDVRQFGQEQRNSSYSPKKVHQSVPAIVGQYNAGHHRHQSDLPVPSSQNKGHSSKKRGRTEGQYRRNHKEDITTNVDMPVFDEIGENYPKRAELLGGDEDADDYDDGDAETGSESEKGVTPTHRLEEVPENVHEDVPEDVPQKTPAPNYRNLKLPVNPASSAHSLDLAEEELRKMEYAKLSTESWEPAHEAPISTSPDGSKDVSLEQRVEYYALNQAATGWDDQVTFYKSLNSTEWDEAGDILLFEIGKIFAEMKDAKKEKRKKLEEIEAEIEAREKLVRGKSANIDAKFMAMQAGGEGLLKGKD